jgi:hypothetical protein
MGQKPIRHGTDRCRLLPAMLMCLANDPQRQRWIFSQKRGEPIAAAVGARLQQRPF